MNNECIKTVKCPKCGALEYKGCLNVISTYRGLVCRRCSNDYYNNVLELNKAFKQAVYPEYMNGINYTTDLQSQPSWREVER